MQPKYKYIEIVRGNVTNRGLFYEQPNNWRLDYFGKTGGVVECYHSAFVHSEDFVHYYDSTGNKTGFKGVSVRPDTGKFRAIISLAGRNRRLGQFETAVQAAEAYDAAAIKLHQDFARLNS